MGGDALIRCMYVILSCTAQMDQMKHLNCVHCGSVHQICCGVHARNNGYKQIATMMHGPGVQTTGAYRMSIFVMGNHTMTTNQTTSHVMV